MNSRPPIAVVAACLRKGDLVLAAQRPAGKKLALKWEFPGGKVEPGEDAGAALQREIREELGAQVRLIAALSSFIHHYPDLSIHMKPFLVELEPGSPEPQALEHASLRWLRLDELDGLDWAEADLPILHELKLRLLG